LVSSNSLRFSWSAEDAANGEKKLQLDLEGLNSKGNMIIGLFFPSTGGSSSVFSVLIRASVYLFPCVAIKVELDLKGNENSSAKKKPAGRGRGRGGSAATAAKRGGSGSTPAAKRKR